MVIAISEADPELAPKSYIVPKECPGVKWKINSSAKSCNLKNAFLDRK